MRIFPRGPGPASPSPNPPWPPGPEARQQRASGRIMQRDSPDDMSSALRASQPQPQAEGSDGAATAAAPVDKPNSEASTPPALPPALTPLPSSLGVTAQNTAAFAHNAQLPLLGAHVTGLAGGPSRGGDEQQQEQRSGAWDDDHISTITTTTTDHQAPGSESLSSANASFVLTQSTPPPASQASAAAPAGGEPPSSSDPTQQHAAGSERQPHFRHVWSTTSMAASLSPGGSAVSSPALNALSDLTPLPSPLLVGNGSPPGSWRRAHSSRPGSGGEQTPRSPDQVPVSPTKRKQYGALLLGGSGAMQAALAQRDARQHSRNRSLSEYKPDPLHNVKPRHVTHGESTQQGGAQGNMLATTTTTTTTTTPPPQQKDQQASSNDAAMLQREQYLADERGHTSTGLPKSTAQQLQQLQLQQAQAALPTPPSSDKSNNSIDSNRSFASDDSYMEDSGIRDPDVAILTLRQPGGKRQKMYQPVRLLGQGTFSKVVLATSDPKFLSGVASPEESAVDPKTLVAIKIVEHGPAGGADEERVELGLHREVETLLSLSHPSLVRIRTFDLDVNPSLLVLDYCPGGDLFDLATGAREPLKLPIVRRIYAELVNAVGYLHQQWIVHRDIKLENVLVNVPPATLLSPTPETLSSMSTHPHPIITLTDLGLCKQIPQPPESPMLMTRCGSEDYAAPEILLGQPYDGRATDAWALGVLLYALMERRLPFDPPPGHKGRKGRPAHRIARCEWVWCRFGDEDGEWDDALAVGDGAKAADWSGARLVVEGLLKKVSRGRASVADVLQMPWVADAIQVDGGLSRTPLDDDDEGRDIKPLRPYPFKRLDTAAVIAKHARAASEQEAAM